MTTIEYPRSLSYLTTDEAAAMARVAPKTIRAWVRRGVLQAHYAGRLLRIRVEDLVEFLRGGGSEPRETVAEIANRIGSTRRGG